MRIVLFDGILERHVHESLARALRARGHEVLSTGKIGHGFRFPPPGAPLAHLERAVDEAIAFAPDWLLCLRPASLPPVLLARLRRAGVRLAAWFSDDPVLFDLSYGPVVEQYDRIAHCGGVEVLQHYERFFGRPTGINLPFWTDHQAFPAVWGTEPAESQVMFLGNVHDAVRRRRYFELASFGPGLRIHGKIGADHFGIGAGYLDSDAEIVAAGASTTWSLSIPQKFSDHRGLETWFPGLDDLGTFELPSRVIQAMAMGIPTISVVPDGRPVEHYPEMLVVRTVHEARDIVRDDAWTSSALAEASAAVLRRFDLHFSADARVRALERFLDDDAWMSLDAHERVSWFARAADEGGAPVGSSSSAADAGGIRASDGVPTRAPALLRISDGPEHEDSVVPGLSRALDEAGLPLTSWQDLRGLEPGALAALCAVDGAVVVPRGPRDDPQIDELLRAVLRGVDLVLLARSVRVAEWLTRGACMFESVEELRMKARRLDASPSLRRAMRETGGSVGSG